MWSNPRAFVVIRDDIPFEVETDASVYAIVARLSQGGRPATYMSRVLNKYEQKYSVVKVSAVINAIWKWSQFLKGRHFNLTADQRSDACMFDQKNHAKTKNTMIIASRLELGQLSYTTDLEKKT